MLGTCLLGAARARDAHRLSAFQIPENNVFECTVRLQMHAKQSKCSIRATVSQ